MQTEHLKLPPSQDQALSMAKPRSSKLGPNRPRTNPDVTWQQVRMDQIRGLDPEIKQFFGGQNLNFQPLPDVKIWTVESAWWSYTLAPMLLIQRKEGFDVLGSGRAWRVAQLIFEPQDAVNALVLSNVKRVSTRTKLQIMAADLFMFGATYRTQPKRAQKLLKLWRALAAKGVPCIAGDDIKAFSRATGYSLRALTSSKAPKKAVKAPEQATSNPNRPGQDSVRSVTWPPEPDS